MPLLAFNRKDTGGESIGSVGPWAADFASSTGKPLHCGGIVTGAAGIGDRLTQLWLPAFSRELAPLGVLSVAFKNCGQPPAVEPRGDAD